MSSSLALDHLASGKVRELYDAGEGTVTVHRVAYPLEATRDKIRAAGLPPALGERLRLGV